MEFFVVVYFNITVTTNTVHLSLHYCCVISYSVTLLSSTNRWIVYSMQYIQLCIVNVSVGSMYTCRVDFTLSDSDNGNSLLLDIAVFKYEQLVIFKIILAKFKILIT